MAVTNNSSRRSPATIVLFIVASLLLAVDIALVLIAVQAIL